MILQKIEEGVCPFCGNDTFTLECTDSGIEDDYYFYKMHCRDCQGEYIEWHKLVFKDIQIKNTFIPAGKEGYEYEE